MSKIKVIVTQGLPASGKSTWARKWVNEDPKNRVRVNRDDIRNMLGPYWIPQREDLVTSIEDCNIRMALSNKYNVVVDATNLRGTQRFERLAKDSNLLNEIYEYDDYPEIKVETKDFTDVSIETCIQRDAERDEGHVGKDVILNMAEKYDLL